MSKRNAILAAATKLFSENGFQGASMARLSKAANAAGGTIFHHFRNKEDLFVEILKDIEDSIASRYDRHKGERECRNGMETVESAVLFYLRLACDLEDRFLLLHRHFPYRMAETNAECRASLESIHNCLLDIFEEGIRLGMEDGSVRAESARDGAMILFAMVDGVVRFNTYKLYDAGALYNGLMSACRRLFAGEARNADCSP
jgi:TetR/AcrR family transcriptional regulator, fatty acid metabolism regulator protein